MYLVSKGSMQWFSSLRIRQRMPFSSVKITENLIAIYSNFDYEVIDPSRFGESVNEEEIKAFQKQERKTLNPVNICTKKIDFIKYPVAEAYY